VHIGSATVDEYTVDEYQTDQHKTDEELMQDMLDAAEWACDLLGHENAVFLIRRKGQYLGKVSAMHLWHYNSDIERHLRLEYGVGVYSVCANVDGAIRGKHRTFRIGTRGQQRHAERERDLAQQDANTGDNEEDHDDLGAASETESEKLSRVLGEFLEMLASTSPRRRR
jgi:hypothetical protein